MGDSRKNIKCSPDTFNRLSNLKEDADEEWDPFLNSLVDTYERVHGDGDEPNSEMTIAELYERLSEDHSNLPEQTAKQVEDRFR